MPQMSEWQTFELRRQSDALVYTFDRLLLADGSAGYKRRDEDLWIIQKPNWGWVAWDEVSCACLGRPWNVLPSDQGDHPPEGDWVSRKREKSYVYRLVYI